MVATPPQTDTYNTALDIFDRTHPLRVDADENLKVVGTFTVVPSGTQDVNIVSTIPLPVTGTFFQTTQPVSIAATVNVAGTTNQGTPNAGGALAWPVLNIAQLIPVAFDYVALSPTGTNPTTVIYKTGGAGGTTVSTLTLTYDGNNNVQTVTRT